MSETEASLLGYDISTDKNRLDVAAIHKYLSESSYWAQGRSLAAVRTSIEHSLCFGAYRGHELAGFARVVTDHATFAWLCDVFVLEAHRGRGIGKALVRSVMAHPVIRGLRLTLLATRDAHTLYQWYGGFNPLEHPERWMERRIPRRVLVEAEAPEE
jgi:GNAT superfamily N-acetyltransferase